ncbi:MAG TPA: hypothetical protein DDW52_30340 [Planctomycetaceae bacterium]|nr:hypothetical protein [Planctomycetaceae bacterium]
MALTQDVDISETKLTGQTLGAVLTVNDETVQLYYVARPIGTILARESAAVGSGAATTLLSYFDTSTGGLSASGETHALSLSVSITGVGAISGTLDTYFS